MEFVQLFCETMCLMILIYTVFSKQKINFLYFSFVSIVRIYVGALDVILALVYICFYKYYFHFH